MSKPRFIAAIDQGTTSTRCCIFDRTTARRDEPARASADFPAAGLGRARSDRDLATHAGSGRARRSCAPARSPATSARSASPISARRRWCGIVARASRCATRSSGRTRARKSCAISSKPRAAAEIRRITGLPPATYFSGPKLAWILTSTGVQAQTPTAIAFGTIDSWLIWNLTGGTARHRCHQRIAHAADEHRIAPVG